MSRPLVFLRSSAQPCAAARVLVARLGGIEKDSRRTRGLKSARFTGAFSANQRKPANGDDLLIVRQGRGRRTGSRTFW
jgi:hypothetical protein